MPTKEKLHLLSSKKEPEPSGPLDLQRAQALVQGHLHALGLHHQGLRNSGHGGAYVGPTQLYYDWQPDTSTLDCSALVYHFRHAPSENVLNAYQEESNSQSLGNAKLVYEADNQGMYLTKSFHEDMSASQFRKEMDHLLKAANKWSMEGCERVAERLHSTSPKPNVLMSSSPPSMPIPGPVATSSSPKASAHSTEEVASAGKDLAVVAAVPIVETLERPATPESSPQLKKALSNSLLAPPPSGVRPNSAPASPSTTLHHPRPKRSGAQAPPSSRTPSPGPASSASAELHHFFKERLPKIFHHHHEEKEKEEEAPKRHSPQTRLDINEPRPTGMPLKIYSSNTSSRAAWER